MFAQRSARHGGLHDGMESRVRTSRRGTGVGSGSGDPETQPLFGYMFPVAPFEPPDELLEMLAARMAWADQPLNPSTESKIPSGYTALGQFITHDLTHDRSPLAGRPGSRPLLKNHRTPALDLDSVYGPSPFLNTVPPRDFKTGKMLYRESPGPAAPDDLLRYVDVKKPDDRVPYPDGQAIIGDPRNDENIVLSQLHLAFLKLHNVFVDRIRTYGFFGAEVPEEQIFDRARDLCRWHYQWVVVHDYLPRIVGKQTVCDVLSAPDIDHPERGFRLYGALTVDGEPIITPPTMPFEFSAAAFRFGHSMVRTHYTVNSYGALFPLIGSSEQDERQLAGGRRLTDPLVVDWSRFFDDLPRPATLADDRPFERNFAMKIDSNITDLLAMLPKSALPPGDTGPTSLPHRDLLRGVRLGLPSGEYVARIVQDRVGGFEILSKADLGLMDFGWDGEAPLWFYILKEAELTLTESKSGDVATPGDVATTGYTVHPQGGERLGPVGGRIVAEVILRLLCCDSKSYSSNGRNFVPETSDSSPDGSFRMADLLRLAGVAPDVSEKATPTTELKIDFGSWKA